MLKKCIQEVVRGLSFTPETLTEALHSRSEEEKSAHGGAVCSGIAFQIT